MQASQYSVPETATAPATSQAAPLVAPSASPAVAFASGPAVPMPAPLAPASDPASGPTVRAPFTAASESVPEPPNVGGSDYNPADWQPPSDWQPTAVAPPPAAPAATSAAGRWTSAAASRPKAQPQQREQAQPSTSDIAAEGAKAPEWEVGTVCGSTLLVYYCHLLAPCCQRQVPPRASPPVFQGAGLRLACRVSGQSRWPVRLSVGCPGSASASCMLPAPLRQRRWTDAAASLSTA